MPFYRLHRHVIYDAACGQTREVWGIDRQPTCPRIKTVGAPRDTDADDPLRHGDCGCPLLLKLDDGRFVSWNNIWEWLSEAEGAGYEVVSGFKKMSPYSTIVLQGP
jgi:hypothetical protein